MCFFVEKQFVLSHDLGKKYEIPVSANRCDRSNHSKNVGSHGPFLRSSQEPSSAFSPNLDSSSLPTPTSGETNSPPHVTSAGNHWRGCFFPDLIIHFTDQVQEGERIAGCLGL